MLRKKIIVALAGNPNCGKTSIFNNLTGLRQDVGNYPGVTVEKKTGTLVYQDYDLEVIDLPGTYSLSAYSDDELVTRNFILEEKPDVVVNVVDASNLERNLYLTVQLLELEAPLVLAMNMSDMVAKKGYAIDYDELSARLGAPVIPTVGHRSEGTKELLENIVRFYENKVLLHAAHVDYGPEIFDEVRSLEHILEGAILRAHQYPLRWVALKVLEQDPWVLGQLKSSANAEQIFQQKDKSRQHLKAHFGAAPEIMMADRRYGFISGAVKTVRSSIGERQDTSDMIDQFVLNRVIGFPIFAGIMYLIFKFTFNGSAPLVEWLTTGFEWLAGFAAGHVANDLLRSFLVDGLINGVGSLLEFVPLIMFMFLAIAFFEDSGYMARAAFLMDKFMARFGLHGKSFLPLMISTNGCAALGMMASRTLEDPKDRLITMMVTPFMICGAKLPIFAVFIAAFFPLNYQAVIMFSLYILSIVVALISAWILRRFVFKGEVDHFIMELPPYRLPSLKGVLLKTWERGWVYLKKAGTVILAISVIIWAGFAFPKVSGVPHSEQIKRSYVGQLAHMIEPVLRPIGMDWRAGVALVGGVAAKEVVVSTFGTIYSLQENGGEETSLAERLRKDPMWNPLKAFVFLLFCLLYAPCCVSAVVFFKESRSWVWTTLLMFGTTAFAWVVCLVVYQVGLLL